LIGKTNIPDQATIFKSTRNSKNIEAKKTINTYCLNEGAKHLY